MRRDIVYEYCDELEYEEIQDEEVKGEEIRMKNIRRRKGGRKNRVGEERRKI
jgi:hypothetical protein